MMRIPTFASLLGAAALAVAGCTVHDVDQPALTGPSTFAHSITLVADRNTLTQNGSDFTDIRITSLGPDGQSENIPLRAQIIVNGAENDFGTLSTKTPITPTTVRYTAPPASGLATQIPTTVTIAVTPSNNGDFRNELSRTVEIRLTPQGVILPTNPNLVASFTFTPATPQVGQTMTFDASSTTNNGTACGALCSYSWNFGDGTTSTGLTTTHQFRSSNSFSVTLTATDAFGAASTKTTTITVAIPAPPTGTFSISPTPPVGTNTDVFFSAASLIWAGRTVASYDWNFGDGAHSGGVTASHKYGGVGSYSVTLTVTDTGGAQATTAPQTVVVNSSGGALAKFTVSPASPKVGQQAVFDASTSTPSTGSTIVSYKFNYGDGTEEVVANPVQSHVYGAAGTVTASLETTDTNGKTSTAVLTVTITP